MEQADRPAGIEVNWTATARGFIYGTFNDLYDSECSIQESSLATDSAIWLGVNGRLGRMHLNREQVADLMGILEVFVRYGDLREFFTQVPTSNDATRGEAPAQAADPPPSAPATEPARP